MVGVSRARMWTTFFFLLAGCAFGVEVDATARLRRRSAATLRSAGAEPSFMVKMQVRLPYAFAEFQDDDDKRLKFATSVANTSGVGVDQVDWPFYADPTLVSATLADVEITTASQEEAILLVRSNKLSEDALNTKLSEVGLAVATVTKPARVLQVEQRGGTFQCGDDIFDHQMLPGKATDDAADVTCETVDRDSDGFIDKAEALCGFLMELKSGHAVSIFAEPGTLVWSEGAEFSLERYVTQFKSESESIVDESSKASFESWITKSDTDGDGRWSVAECIAQGLDNPFVNEGNRAPVCTKDCSSTEPCTDCECCGRFRRECGGTCSCPGLSWLCKASIEADFDWSASYDECLAPRIVIWPAEDWPPPLGGLAWPIISALDTPDYNMTNIVASGMIYENEEEPRITCLPPGCMAACDSQCFALAYADNIDYLDMGEAASSGGYIKSMGATDLDSLFVVLITLVCFHILGCALCCRGICFPRQPPGIRAKPLGAQHADAVGKDAGVSNVDKAGNGSSLTAPLRQVMAGGGHFGTPYEPQPTAGYAFPMYPNPSQAFNPGGYQSQQAFQYPTVPAWFAQAPGASQWQSTPQPTQGGGQPTQGGGQPTQGGQAAQVEGAATQGVELAGVGGAPDQGWTAQAHATLAGEILPVAEPATTTTTTEEEVVGKKSAGEEEGGTPSEEAEDRGDSEDAPASQFDKAQAVWALFQEVVGKASNLASLFISSTSVGIVLAILLVFEVGLVYFYGSKEMYVPGCIYNDVHVLRRGVNFGKRYKDTSGFPMSLKLSMTGMFLSSKIFDIAATCVNIASISCFLGLGTVDIAKFGYFKIISTFVAAILSFQSSSMGVAMVYVIWWELLYSCFTCCCPAPALAACWKDRLWVAMYERL